MLARMHKAISIIQFKLEGALIDRHPEWNMDDRKLLHRINLVEGTITLPEGTFPLLDNQFPTIDPSDPYRLTPRSRNSLTNLCIRFLYPTNCRATWTP